MVPEPAGLAERPVSAFLEGTISKGVTLASAVRIAVVAVSSPFAERSVFLGKRFVVCHQAEARRVSADGHLFENELDFGRDAFGKFYGAETVEELDASDFRGGNSRFPGYCPDDVPR